MAWYRINVSPYATNVLDLVGAEDLSTRDGKPVRVAREGSDFVVYVDGQERSRTDINTSASYVLNMLDVGRTR